jgi:hypothetical protein
MIDVANPLLVHLRFQLKVASSSGCNAAHTSDPALSQPQATPEIPTTEEFLESDSSSWCVMHMTACTWLLTSHEIWIAADAFNAVISPGVYNLITTDQRSVCNLPILAGFN